MTLCDTEAWQSVARVFQRMDIPLHDEFYVLAITRTKLVLQREAREAYYFLPQATDLWIV
jgi:hypothetical protein